MKFSIAVSALTAALVTKSAAGLLGLDINLGISLDIYLGLLTHPVTPGYQMCSNSEYSEIGFYQVNNNMYMLEKEAEFTQCSAIISQENGITWTSFIEYHQVSTEQMALSFPNIQRKMEAVAISSISTIETKLSWSYEAEPSITANVVYCLSLSDGFVDIELNVWLSAGETKAPGSFVRITTILNVSYEVYVLSSSAKSTVVTYVMVGVSVTTFEGNMKDFVDDCLAGDAMSDTYQLLDLVAGFQVVEVETAKLTMSNFAASIKLIE